MNLDLPRFETLLLGLLFGACLIASAWVFGAMLGAQVTPPTLATSGLGAVLLHGPDACMLPPDGVVCPRQPG